MQVKQPKIVRVCREPPSEGFPTNLTLPSGHSLLLSGPVAWAARRVGQSDSTPPDKQKSVVFCTPVLTPLNWPSPACKFVTVQFNLLHSFQMPPLSDESQLQGGQYLRFSHKGSDVEQKELVGLKLDIEHIIPDTQLLEFLYSLQKKLKIQQQSVPASRSKSLKSKDITNSQFFTTLKLQEKELMLESLHRLQVSKQTFRSRAKYRKRSAKAAAKLSTMKYIDGSFKRCDKAQMPIKPSLIASLVNIRPEEVCKWRKHQKRQTFQDRIIPLTKDPVVINAIRDSVVESGLRDLTVQRISLKLKKQNLLRTPSNSTIRLILQKQLGLAFKTYNSSKINYQNEQYDSRRIWVCRILAQLLKDEVLVITIDEATFSSRSTNNRQWQPGAQAIKLTKLSASSRNQDEGPMPQFNKASDTDGMREQQYQLDADDLATPSQTFDLKLASGKLLGKPYYTNFTVSQSAKLSGSQHIVTSYTQRESMIQQYNSNGNLFKIDQSKTHPCSTLPNESMGNGPAQGEATSFDHKASYVYQDNAYRDMDCKINDRCGHHAQLQLQMVQLSRRVAQSEKSTTYSFNFVAAMSIEEVLGMQVLEGTMDATLFGYFITQLLTSVRADPRHKHKQILLFLDNATVHGGQLAQEAAAQMEATIVYNSPYSPWLMPVEMLHRHLKRYIKSLPTQPNKKDLPDVIQREVRRLNSTNQVAPLWSYALGAMITTLQTGHFDVT